MQYLHGLQAVVGAVSAAISKDFSIKFSALSAVLGL